MGPARAPIGCRLIVIRQGRKKAACLEDSQRIDGLVQRRLKGIINASESCKAAVRGDNTTRRILGGEAAGPGKRQTCLLLPALAALAGLRSPLPLIGGNLWPSHRIAERQSAAFARPIGGRGVRVGRNGSRSDSDLCWILRKRGAVIRTL